jgi:hypothetical protein
LAAVEIQAAWAIFAAILLSDPLNCKKTKLVGVFFANAAGRAHTISRILRSPRLPSLARQRILEYMREKIEGYYGHTERRRREFAECLMAALRNEFKLTFERQESDRRRLLTERPFPVSEVKSRRRKDRSSAVRVTI